MGAKCGAEINFVGSLIIKKQSIFKLFPSVINPVGWSLL